MTPFKGTALEGKHPMDMIGRLALLDKLRQVGPSMINRLTKEAIGNFLVEIPTKCPETGMDTTDVEINWEYALFKANDKELEDLMSNFIAKAKPNEQQSKLLKV